MTNRLRQARRQHHYANATSRGADRLGIRQRRGHHLSYGGRLQGRDDLGDSMTVCVRLYRRSQLYVWAKPPPDQSDVLHNGVKIYLTPHWSDVALAVAV